MSTITARGSNSNVPRWTLSHRGNTTNGTRVRTWRAQQTGIGMVLVLCVHMSSSEACPAVPHLNRVPMISLWPTHRNRVAALTRTRPRDLSVSPSRLSRRASPATGLHPQASSLTTRRPTRSYPSLLSDRRCQLVSTTVPVDVRRVAFAEYRAPPARVRVHI